MFRSLIAASLMVASAAAQDLGPQTLGPGARPIGADWSRSPVIAQHGMAATAQPLALADRDRHLEKRRHRR